MMSDSKRSPSGSLLRCGVGLLLIAMSLRWIVAIVQSSWPWLVGLLAVSAAAWLAVRWWRNRREWGESRSEASGRRMGVVRWNGLSSGELVQDNRRNRLSSGISRNGAVAARVPRLILRQPAGRNALTPLLQATGRTVGGLIPQGGTHDGPAWRWPPWFVAAGAVGAGAAKRHGSPGGSTDCAGNGAANGGG